ncbi:hypothetical protein OPW07_10415 [Vibrio europaeus]|uniref:Uncharacterized protein n=1 Tax=Vibrio europaeus TaxID=300876 RepID=A0AAE7AT76_9VIBR|nr:hypothetical protein [Vibrio europaeus]MDC5810128.1 hypothetical protein [Vibrio europaeus]QJY36257.1 hypothetical protein HOO69_06355 [Vibrio europaeus]QPG35070.1 hypothetical protein IXK98_16450 [Vibrio europaeus]
MKKVIGFFLVVTFIASIGWIVSDAYSYEPWIVVMGSLISLLSADWGDNKNKKSPLKKFQKRLEIRKSKLTPEAMFKFDALVNGNAQKHTISVMAVWDGDAPTTKKQVIHQTDNLSSHTIMSLDGAFSFSFQEVDIDNDGHNEIIMIFHCGAHSRGVKVFKVSDGHFLSLFPGGEFGGDHGDVRIEKHDGINKIYVCSRGTSLEEVIERCYFVDDGILQEKLI